MTVEHIRWEFGLHKVGYHVGNSNANTTNLDSDETLWRMFLRWIGVK